MPKYFLVGVGNVNIYDPTTGDLIATSKTMLDNTITTTTAASEIRGGTGNQLQYVYFHDPKMEVTLTETQFSLAWLSATVGASINTGKNVWFEETITLGAGGTGSVTKTPLTPPDNTTIYGWVTDSNQTTTKVTFTGQNFTLAGGTSGQVVTVRYYLNNTAVTSVAIPSNLVPKVVRVVIEAQLGLTSSGTSGIAGSVQVEVPRLQLDGSNTISLKSNAEANTPLKGMAIAYIDTTTNNSIYATVTQIINSANWYDNVYAIASVADPIALSSANSPYTLDLRAIPTVGSAFKMPYADMTFVSSAPATCTVNASGQITKVATGNATITCTITNKNTVSCQVGVVVS